MAYVLLSSGFFDQIFYQQLVAGVVAGLLTGLVVGLTILFAQKRIESRRECRKAKRDVASVWENILSAAGEPDTIILGDPRKSAPPSATAILAAVKDLPVAYWRQVLPQNESVTLIAAFNQASRRFTTESAQLRAILSTSVRAYNASRGAISANDHSLVMYYMGKAYGLPDDRILPLLEYATETGEPAPWIVAGAAELKQNDSLSAGLKGHLEAREALMKSINEIRSHPALNLED